MEVTKFFHMQRSDWLEAWSSILGVFLVDILNQIVLSHSVCSEVYAVKY